MTKTMQKMQNKIKIKSGSKKKWNVFDTESYYKKKSEKQKDE